MTGVRRISSIIPATTHPLIDTWFRLLHHSDLSMLWRFRYSDHRRWIRARLTAVPLVALSLLIALFFVGVFAALSAVSQDWRTQLAARSFRLFDRRHKKKPGS
jgi:hypothetical protein